jgi:hypothetical protein
VPYGEVKSKNRPEKWNQNEKIRRKHLVCGQRSMGLTWHIRWLAREMHAQRVAVRGRVNQWAETSIGAFAVGWGWSQCPWATRRLSYWFGRQLEWSNGWIGCGTTEATSGGRIFRRRVWEREGSDLAVLDGSSTVVPQGFDWYINQLETRTVRRRTEEDRAMRTIYIYIYIYIHTHTHTHTHNLTTKI